MIQINSLTKRRDSDLENELMVAGLEGIVKGLWGGHIHIAIFKMDNQQGPIV